MLKRIFFNIFFPFRKFKKYFSRRTLENIELLIQNSEKRHDGEIVFVVEEKLPLSLVLRKVSPRERAIELFSRFRVWDTEHNCGVLIYLLFSEKQIEIIADRGIAKKVSQKEWDSIIERMKSHFQKKHFEKGVILGIAEITDILATHFPISKDKLNELSNKPIIMN
ncbi:MAG: TPM domain-containing protein [Leptospiraceae bacterium]|nr:TPM domain-containing protein [Leptospiraceae bacterium]